VKILGFLVADPSRLSREEASAWKFLVSNHRWGNTLLPFDQILNNPGCLKRISALWWHYDSSTALFPQACDGQILTILREYVERGGTIFLSLLAARYVVDLGLELVPPNVAEKGAWSRRCWAENFPDIRGLSSYRGHPIFEGLHGAAYLWNPNPGTPFAGTWYEAPLAPANGRVVAIEREYIKLNEDCRVAVEYSHGKGKVLTVGSFLFFADESMRFRPHLERFAENCLAYLAGPPTGRGRIGARRKRPGRATSFWNFEPGTVRFRSRNTMTVLSMKPRAWRPSCGRLSLTRDQATGNFFDLGAGGRFLWEPKRGGLRKCGFTLSGS